MRCSEMAGLSPSVPQLAPLSPRTPSSAVRGFNKQGSAAFKCCNTRTMLNIILIALGLAVIKLPYVFAYGGWVGGFVMLLSACLISMFSVWRLYYVLTTNVTGRNLRSFEEIGLVLFGVPGKVTFWVLIYVTLFMGLVIRIVLIAEGLQTLLPIDAGIQIWIWLTIAILIPFTWLPSLKEVAILSGIGVIAMLALVGIITASSVNRISTVEPAETALVPTDFMLSLASFSTCFYSFYTTHSIPSILGSMRTPSELPSVVAKSFTISMGIYLVVCASSYAAFGYGMEEYDHILQPVSDSSKVFGYLSQGVVVLLVVCQYMVLFSTWARFLDTTFVDNVGGEELTMPATPCDDDVHLKGLSSCPGSEVDISLLSFDLVEASRWKRSFLRVLVRTTFTLFVGLAASLVPQPGALLLLVSSVTVVLNTVAVPLICYWRTLQQLKQPHPSYWVLSLEVALVLMAGGLVAVGTKGAVEKLGGGGE